MLSPVALITLAATVIATSFLSGIFGMAGGMVLLGVLLIFMDVAPAMVLFGVTQATANGWRAWLWRRYVQWRIVGHYIIGSALTFLVVRLIAFLPRPGEWMETFKQLMGFVLLGTVVFLVSAVGELYIVPTLAMLVGLGLACWFVGRIPMTANTSPMTSPQVIKVRNGTPAKKSITRVVANRTTVAP